MNKVTTINLNGKAYQLEESGYEKLHQYLQSVRRSLDGNPDQEEIVKDFEQAIAEKCDKYIQVHKNVVTEPEIETIIKEMGPIDGSDDTASHAEHKDSMPKRLYRIKEGAWIAGVCNGIAAYFGIDVLIVRIVFIIFALFTHGGGIGLYILMAFFVPAAETNEERAFARGKQFNSQEFMEEMKAKYGKYADEQYWKGYGKSRFKRKYRKYANEQYWKEYAESKKRYATSVAKGWISFTRVGTGIFAFIGSVVLAGIAVFYSIAMWTIIVNGSAFHKEILVGTSPVFLALFVTAAAYAVLWPIRKLVNEAKRHTFNIKKNHHHIAGYIIGGTLWIVALGFVITVAIFSTPHNNKNYQPYGTDFWIHHHYVCIGANYYCNPEQITENANTQVITNQVQSFGQGLQLVSLLAPKADIKTQMDKVYGPYLTPELLKQWEAHPDTALGREVSSPWPDHINVGQITKNTDDTYTVTGDVIELTSDEVEHGGIAGEYPVTLRFVKSDTWRVSGVVRGAEMPSTNE